MRGAKHMPQRSSRDSNARAANCDDNGIATMDIDLKACLVLKMLSAGTPDACIDYEPHGGVHRFLISCQGLRYELCFLERLFEACSADEITHATSIAVDRIQRRAIPRRMKFGSMAGHGAAPA